MKIIALAIFAAALGCAQSQPSTSAGTSPAPGTAPEATPAPKPAPKTATAAKNKKPVQPTPQQKAAAQSQTPSIPAGATLVEPNLYRYTDSNGKTWNYRQTPFGISRWEASSSSAPEAKPDTSPKRDPVTVTDLGDSYRFDKKTPFGQSTWVQKKSALTDDEKAIVGQQTQANQSSVESKPAGNQ